MATSRVKPQAEAAAEERGDDHVARMRRLAQGRLERLFDEAIGARFYGRVMIEIHFEGGRPVLISRRISVAALCRSWFGDHRGSGGASPRFSFARSTARRTAWA